VSVIEVTGGKPLRGEVAVVGAKNSVLKLMAASLLAVGKTTLQNVPNIVDVVIMAELLRRLGCNVQHDIENRSVSIDVPELIEHRADYDLVRQMRASICVLGPLLARTGQAEVAMPGGDAIGSRGLDFHIAGLQQLGASVTSEHGYLVADTKGMHGASMTLDFPSVGATETLLMAAVLARGVSVIDNAAREPEIVDICSMLETM
jgi:UDP-N-acetylglucosamine 1-carboxyvinyltransferase